MRLVLVIGATLPGRRTSDGAVTARLPETYQWLLVPEQAAPQAAIVWQATRLSAGDALAVRASKKLRSDETMVTLMGATILRKHLDDVPLWRGEVAHAQAPALENARRKIRPAPALHLVLKVEDGLPALVVAQRFQKRSRGGHDGGGLG